MYELRIGKARPVGGSTTLGPPGRLRCRQRPEAYHADRIWARSEQAALDLSQIDGFEWDEGNNRKGVEKHDVSQAEAEQTFFNEPLRDFSGCQPQFSSAHVACPWTYGCWPAAAHQFYATSRWQVDQDYFGARNASQGTVTL